MNFASRFTRLSALMPLIFGIMGCSPASQWIVLYQDRVVAGKSIAWFASHNDPDGHYARIHCHALAKAYEREDKRTYICSDKIFEEFRPKVK